MASSASNIDWRQLHGDAFASVRVLVTGGAGFIGSHVTEALGKLGATVAIIDDLSAGDASNAKLAGAAELIDGSILDPGALSRAVTDCRYVFHLAAKVSVPASVENPRVYHDVNATGTFNVLDAAVKAGVRRVIFSASSSAYGDSPVLPKVETMPPDPASPYAATKSAGEGLMRAFARSYPIDTASLRYFNIFGPRQSPNSAYAAVVAAFAKRLMRGEPPIITGDGTASRDFTFVANAVHANLLAARHPQPIRGDVFNVATGESRSVTQLATTMAALLGRPELKPVLAPPRPGDVLHSKADLTKIRGTFGYAPIVSFEDGLKATVAWYRALSM
jgi:nucleoside-diphosphate-sugar epimerase